MIALRTPWARDLCAQSDQSSAVTCAGSTITTGLACGMQFCHRVLCSAQQCLGKSVEDALVASQALVSPHLMFIFGYFLVGIKCAWESRVFRLVSRGPRKQVKPPVERNDAIKSWVTKEKFEMLPACGNVSGFS